MDLCVISTSSPQTGTDKIAASKMSLKAWILVLTQSTQSQQLRLLIQHVEDPHKDTRITAKMSASSAKSRSEILTFPNDAPQIDLSDILPIIQSIQALKSVGGQYMPITNSNNWR